jgi:small subunit ribosomal protein S20
VANHASSLKRIRQTERRRLRNRMVRQSMRTQVKDAKVEVKNNTKDAKASVIEAISKIDKAASKGVIHHRAAARRVARLSKLAEKVLLAK